MAMTKSERDQLLSLVKKRERVMKQQAAARSGELLAEFEAQSTKIHKFDEDAVWSEAMGKAQSAVTAAQEIVERQCRKLGIPAEFAPSIACSWYGRGENAFRARQAELRRAAKTRIAAMETEAVARIEAFSLQAQTEIITHGLESAAAKEFLGKMPSLDKLMPQVQFAEIKQLWESKKSGAGVRAITYDGGDGTLQ